MFEEFRPLPISARFAPAPNDDRRISTRHTLQLGVNGHADGSDPHAARVLNISNTGMLVECPLALAQSDVFTVNLPQSGECEAEVVWADAPMFGCRFRTELSDGALAAARLAGKAESRTIELAPDSPADMEDFGERLHRLRSERGLSLSDVADRLGVSKPTVWAWEHGKSRPIERRLASLAQVLGVTPAGLQPAPPSQDEIVARHRRRIAEMYGVEPERVRIMIDL